MGNVQQSGGRLWPVGVALAAGGGDGGRPVGRARRPGDGDGQRRPSCGRPSPEHVVVATEMGNVQRSAGRLSAVGVALAAGWGDGSGAVAWARSSWRRKWATPVELRTTVARTR